MNKPPRICMVIERYAPLVGGSETQCRLLVSQLHQRGVSVRVVTRHIDKSTARLEEIDGVQVHRVGPSGIGRVWKELGFAFSAAFALIGSRNSFDCLHLHSGTSIGGAVVILCAKVLRKPILVKVATAGDIVKQVIETSHNVAQKPSPLHRAVSALINRILHAADCILCISKEIQREATQAGFDVDRLRLLPNAINTDSFSPPTENEKFNLRERLGLSRQKMLFLFSGRLIYRKGVDTLLDAWSKLPHLHQQATLLLLGSGSTSLDDFEKVLRSTVKEYNMQGSVEFLGERRTPLDYLRVADVFVFPSRREGLPNALLEAMSVGLPSICSSIGGNIDLIQHEANGVLFPVDDSKKLAKEIERLAKSASLRILLGRRARETVLVTYSASVIVPRLLATYVHFLEQQSHGISR